MYAVNEKVFESKNVANLYAKIMNAEVKQVEAISYDEYFVSTNPIVVEVGNRVFAFSKQDMSITSFVKRMINIMNNFDQSSILIFKEIMDKVSEENDDIPDYNTFVMRLFSNDIDLDNDYSDLRSLVLRIIARLYDDKMYLGICWQVQGALGWDYITVKNGINDLDTDLIEYIYEPEFEYSLQYYLYQEYREDLFNIESIINEMLSKEIK